VNEPYLGPAEPRERLESLVPLAADLLRRDGHHFTMAQVRRPDGVWELVDVDRAGDWEAVADIVREGGCDAVIVVAEARARSVSPAEPGPDEEVLLFATARAKAVSGLDEVTRAALEAAEAIVIEDAQPAQENVVALASRRR